MSPVSTVNHRHLSITDSTNSALIEEIQSAKLETTVPHLLTAETQRAGRGQHGRSWQSPKGNVYLSLYLPMRVPLTGLLSLIIGFELVMIPAIYQLNSQRRAQQLPPIGVKWANDLGFYGAAKTTPSQYLTATAHSQQNLPQASPLILFNKLAGILIEPVWQAGRLLGCVIGVGMNVRTAPLLTNQTLEGMSYQAVSLADLASGTAKTSSTLPPLSELYTQITQALLKAGQRFERLTLSPPLIESFLSQFAQVDVLLNKKIIVTRQIQAQSQQLSGIASGIDSHGCLQLRCDDATLISLFTGRIDAISAPINSKRPDL